jgi:hypothetical protein
MAAALFKCFVKQVLQRSAAPRLDPQIWGKDAQILISSLGYDRKTTDRAQCRLCRAFSVALIVMTMSGLSWQVPDVVGQERGEPIAPIAVESASRETASVDGGDGVSIALATVAAPHGQVDLPEVDPQLPLAIVAKSATTWSEGAYEVLWLQGAVRFQQGPRVVTGEQAMVWIERSEAFRLRPHKMIAYVEDAVVVQAPEPSELTESAAVVAQATQAVEPTRMAARQWIGEFWTYRPITYGFPVSQPLEGDRPAIYDRAMRAREPIPRFTIAPVQFTEVPGAAAPGAPQGSSPPPAGFSLPQMNNARIRVEPRGGTSFQFESFPSADGREQVAVIDSGVNILISGIGDLGMVDIVTDRMVIWMPPGATDVTGQGAREGDRKQIELYLEGNVIFRQGQRIVYANSMYYNASLQIGAVLDAELLTDAPNYEGLLRVKAAVLRQVGPNSFQAQDAAFTSSRLGVPRYWLQSETATFEDRPLPDVDPLTGQVFVNPVTGQPEVEHHRLATSRNNFLYLGGVPILYWPSFRTNFTKPGFIVDSVKLGNDRIFGTQVRVDLNMFHLLNMAQPPEGTEWLGSVDYLSDRGFGIGTTLNYDRDSFFRWQGETKGHLDAWGIHDNGLDNLGADRRGLVPEEENRGRLLWQHRQRFASDWQLTGEIGYITDRNFLEQYYELEWDQSKDQTTGLEFKKLIDNSSWNISADFRVNDFFTQTEWLPRFDHFLLGESLFGDWATLHSHSHVGFARMRTAEPPQDPNDAAKFNPLAWEADVEGVRAGTRNEIDVPFELGPVKVVPYAGFDATYWGETLSGDDATRLMGELGIRSSLPMWRVDPTVNSTLFNLSGLAHKVVFDADFYYADADQNFETLPLYDPLDDDAVEHFRRRFVDDSFGGALFVNDLVPARFDERTYALRSGLQRWVTSPSAEIADDLMVLQLGARQRWQTKRGAPGSQRIIDWMTLDTQASFFPKDERDDFGAGLGLLNYDWRWHVGDRLTLMSDGYADLFGEGLRMLTLGGYIGRPERGSMYVGLRSIEGPISSNILINSFSYRMSPKWIGTATSTVDFGRAGNIGQRVELTRVGESFLVSFGVNVDASRDSVGVGFAVEPRFLPLTRRGYVGGVQIPPAGARGLE